MRLKTLVATAIVALFAAACDKPGDSQANRSTPPGDPSAATGASQPGNAKPNTPANIGAPTQEEKRDGANPTQGQVDPKEREQQRDFKQSGDSKGPTSPQTQPRPGGGSSS